MQSSVDCSSTSLQADSTIQKYIPGDLLVDDEFIETVKNIRPFDIEEIKQRILNSELYTINEDANVVTKKRKRCNTWPIKNVDLHESTNDYEKTFAEKMIKELGIDSGKHLKNPWGNLSYSQLIEKSIECSPWKSLSLKEIYNWFTKYVPFFKDKSNYKSTMGWKVSVEFYYLKFILIYFLSI